MATLLAGCVTTYDPFDEKAENVRVAQIAVPVAIPFADLGANDDPILRQVYDGIIRRLQEAADEGDWRLVDALVDNFDRPELPPALGQQVRSYRGVARGLLFAQHLRSHAELVQVIGGAPSVAPAVTPPLGKPLRLELRVPAPASPVLLGGRHDRDATAFTVAVTIDDEYVDGGLRSTHSDEFVWLPEAFALGGSAVLTMPIDVDAIAGNAVRRSIYVRIDLMPGHVGIGDLRAPMRRVTLAADTWTQWPSGYAVLAKEPMRALRAALLPFTQENFAAAYLAAVAAPAAQRDEVVQLLIDQVRHGDSTQAQVAMAALCKVTGVSLPIGDRDSWLAWYQAQARTRPVR